MIKLNSQSCLFLEFWPEKPDGLRIHSVLNGFCIERVRHSEFKNSLKKSQRYKNLRRIKIYVIVTNKSDFDQCSE